MLQDFQFERYNTSSIEYLFASMSNVNDVATRNEAKNIFDLYIIWHRQNKEDGYMPTHGMERMYSMNAMVDLCSMMDN